MGKFDPLYTVISNFKKDVVDDKFQGSLSPPKCYVAIFKTLPNFSDSFNEVENVYDLLKSFNFYDSIDRIHACKSAPIVEIITSDKPSKWCMFSERPPSNMKPAPVQYDEATLQWSAYDQYYDPLDPQGMNREALIAVELFDSAIDSMNFFWHFGEITIHFDYTLFDNYINNPYQAQVKFKVLPFPILRQHNGLPTYTIEDIPKSKRPMR